MIFFTSDIHFFHNGVIRYCDRPFSSVEEMNSIIIENWNQTVSKKDDVYILGDIAFCGKTKLDELLRKLNGKKYLIRGNHDEKNFSNSDELIWIKDVFRLKYLEHHFWLSHYAHLVWPHQHKGHFHLYGHSHGNMHRNYDSLSFDIGMDAWADRKDQKSYKPLSIEFVLEEMKKHKFTKIDGHGE